MLVLAAGQSVLLLFPWNLTAQRPGTSPRNSRSNSGTPVANADLEITLRDEKSVELTIPAKISLRNAKGAVLGTATTVVGRASYHGLALGVYEVDVEISGHPKTRETISLETANESRYLDITIPLGDTSPGASGPPVPPPLTIREQKQLTEGIRSLQAQNISAAGKHFRSAAKSNPNHPDVDYLLGVTATLKGDTVTAKQYFENAANRYQHVRSLVALGEMNLVEGNLTVAGSYLEKALKSDPNSWRAEQLLAAVNLRQDVYPSAVLHAEHALQLGKTEAKGAQLTLALALSAEGNYLRSSQVLEELLKESPTQAQSKAANQILDSNRRALDTAAAAPNQVSGALSPGSPIHSLGVVPLSPTLPTPSDNPLVDHSRWTPPNVDDAVPPVETVVSCPLPQILQQSGKRVTEFTELLDRFSATERLKHESLNEFGLAVRTEQLKFNYLVVVREVKTGVYDVSEFRDGNNSLDIFPEHVATLGTVALVFVFHPDYRNDFDFRCEGVAHQGGQLAWQIHFQQKPEVQSRLRSYQLGNRYFRVGIKGRAWIAVDSFQILRMESDLVTQVPALRLNAEHQDITYGPVPLKQKDLLLWLPFSAEIYLDFDGHRIHRRQDLSNFVFFWVEDSPHLSPPKQAEGDPNSGTSP
jgi:tetratricopeptide (TPR) repeat protein